MINKQMFFVFMGMSLFSHNALAMYYGEIELSFFEFKDEDRLKKIPPHIQTLVGKFYQYPEPSENLKYTIDIPFYEQVFKNTLKVNLSIAKSNKLPRIVRILHAEKALKELGKIKKELYRKQGESVEDDSSENSTGISESFSEED